VKEKLQQFPFFSDKLIGRQPPRRADTAGITKMKSAGKTCALKNDDFFGGAAAMDFPGRLSPMEHRTPAPALVLAWEDCNHGCAENRKRSFEASRECARSIFRRLQ